RIPVSPYSAPDTQAANKAFSRWGSSSPLSTISANTSRAIDFTSCRLNSLDRAIGYACNLGKLLLGPDVLDPKPLDLFSVNVKLGGHTRSGESVAHALSIRQSG